MSRLDALIDWYQTLTPETLDRLPEFYTHDARFVDPFNDVTGHNAIRAIFKHMFAKLDHPHFSVIAILEDEGSAMLRWQFHFRLRGNITSIGGCSHLICSAQGLIQYQRDYWDSAAFYRQLPGIGRLFRWLSDRMAAP